MRVLVTGASGFLGTALTEELTLQYNYVFGLSRHPPAPRSYLSPLEGDITKPDLGLKAIPKRIDAVYHLAGIHQLGEDKDSTIWKTNVEGTHNVITFCRKHKVPRLYFISTAYTEGRNPYEQSKKYSEGELAFSKLPHVTIFKPSVVMGTEEHPYPGHFSQFVAIVIKLHRRAEIIRRKIEGTLRLPVLEPVFRIKGNPEGKLNLVSVESVAKAMANIKNSGTYWLTNPTPPTLSQLVEWVGEYIMVRMKIEPEFSPSPIEAQFAKIASAFAPYLQGDRFPSVFKHHEPIDREFIHRTIRNLLSS